MEEVIVSHVHIEARFSFQTNNFSIFKECSPLVPFYRKNEWIDLVESKLFDIPVPTSKNFT